VHEPREGPLPGPEDLPRRVAGRRQGLGQVDGRHDRPARREGREGGRQGGQVGRLEAAAVGEVDGEGVGRRVGPGEDVAPDDLRGEAEGGQVGPGVARGLRVQVGAARGAAEAGGLDEEGPGAAEGVEEAVAGGGDQVDDGPGEAGGEARRVAAGQVGLAPPGGGRAGPDEAPGRPPGVELEGAVPGGAGDRPAETSQVVLRVAGRLPRAADDVGPVDLGAGRRERTAGRAAREDGAAAEGEAGPARRQGPRDAEQARLVAGGRADGGRLGQDERAEVRVPLEADELLAAQPAPAPPVWPKPPSPRSVGARPVASRRRTRATGATTSWAIRSPRERSCSRSPRLTSATFTSPR